MRVLTLLAIAAFTVSAQTPYAATCGSWVSQTDGSEWRMCVDQNNQRYCELRRGGTTTRFTCP